MPKKPTGNATSDENFEFSQLFWAARAEQNLRQRNATTSDPGYKAVLDFAENHGWKWAPTLLEASRLDRVQQPEKALQLLLHAKPAIPKRWHGLRYFIQGSAFSGIGAHVDALSAYRKAIKQPFFDRPGFAWNNIGLALRDTGAHDEAIKAFRNAIDDPNYDRVGWTWNILGALLGKKGEHAEAILAFRNALADPKYEECGRTWHNLGIALCAEGKRSDAITAFLKALADPKFDLQGAACYSLGICLHAKGEHDEAIKAFRKALEDPKFETPALAWNNIGASLNAKGAHDEAIAAFRNALDDPNLADSGFVWNNVGIALCAKGDRDAAIEAFRKALTYPQSEKTGSVWCNLGNLLHDGGQYDEAIHSFRNALSDPKFQNTGFAWNNIGASLNAKGEHDEAIKAFRNALDDPKYATPGLAWSNFGTAMRAKGEYDEAIKAFRTALNDPNLDDPGMAWFNLGNLLSAKGEYDEGIKAYHKALEDPRYHRPGSVLNNLGLAHYEKGEYDKAIKAFLSVFDDPDYDSPGIASINLGLALYSNGEYDESIKASRDAIDDPKLEKPGRAWNNLGLALRAKGELNRATEAFIKALDDPELENRARAWTNLAQTHVDAGRNLDAEQAFANALASPDPQGVDHARARRGLQILQSRIATEALSPDDRAMVAKPIGGAPSDEIESRIIAAIGEAGDTQYEKYIARSNSGRNDILSILRGWSSAVTLLEGSERRWRGGGYLLKWRGFGLVIDPGFDFLRNFHDAGYHGREIHAVVVSHNHPDHNSDLKDIDDLRYELFKRLAATKAPGGEPYVLLWDEDTRGSTKFGFEKPQHQYPHIVMGSGFPLPFDLRQHAAKIPVRITPFKVNHGSDVLNAMGIVVELFDENDRVSLRIGYTADTAYFANLHQHLQNCDILIAHISQPSIEELQDASVLKEVHLGYRGTARLLKECKPKLSLIGEFWAGFTDLRIPLVKGLHQITGLDAILPAGLSMHIRLPSLEIECTGCNKPTPFSAIKVAPPSDKFGSLAYLCPKCMIG